MNINIFTIIFSVVTLILGLILGHFLRIIEELEDTNYSIITTTFILIGSLFITIYLLQEYINSKDSSFYGPLFVLMGSLLVFSLQSTIQGWITNKNQIKIEKKEKEKKLSDEKTIKNMIKSNITLDSRILYDNKLRLKICEKIEPIEDNFWDYLFQNLLSFELGENLNENIIGLREYIKMYNNAVYLYNTGSKKKRDELSKPVTNILLQIEESVQEISSSL